MSIFGLKNSKSLIESGFTIVELLVIIVVIGVLSAIIIVSYGSIKEKVVIENLKSDLGGASIQLMRYYAKNGVYPSNQAAIENCPNTDADKICAKISSGNTYLYTSDGNTFTLYATNINEKSYYITNTSSSPILSEVTSITGIAGIGGTSQIGSTLTAGALTPVSATATFQWLRSDTTDINGTYSNISGATGTTYLLQANDYNKYIKVKATGIGNYSSTITSVATSQVALGPWIMGINATPLQGKFVRNADLSGYYVYQTTLVDVTAPQGSTGLDPNYLSLMSLVSPQANPAVDFSAYPAQNACKSIGGRLPNMQELLSIYSNRANYGNNFDLGYRYWSSTEGEALYAYMVFFNSGSYIDDDKDMSIIVRCVTG